MSAIIRINYDEGNENLGYQSVELDCTDKNNSKVFSTGDFIKDWYDMRKYMITVLSDIEPYFIHASSVDHFIMDGAPYDSAYLHMDNDDDKPVFKYFDKTDPKWYLQGVDEGGIEFFVPENTQPTWEEFRDKYKDKE